MKENVPITNPVEMVDPNWMQKTGGYAKDMTLRDYYAGLAMGAFILADLGYDVVVIRSYEMADAMLKAREK
jgi:hypothetical protein